MKDQFLPLSKSWAIRMIFFDMLYGRPTGYKIIKHFQKQNEQDLSDDIQAALECALNYIFGKQTYNARNSGTVCRFLVYILWGANYELSIGEQLKKRLEKEIEKLPSNLTELSLPKLLSLGTSQYASAALIMGAEPKGNLHPKCELTLEANEVYFENSGDWIPRYDEIIIGQLRHFLFAEKIKNPIAEDYCYLRAFNSITYDEGKKLWPELANHESDRLRIMEEICAKGFDRLVDIPDDHRVMMAVVLRQMSLGLPVRVSNRECVSKSWPQSHFWEWVKENS